MNLKCQTEDFCKQFVERPAFATQAMHQKWHEMRGSADCQRRWQMRQGESIGTDFTNDPGLVAKSAVRNDVDGFSLPNNIYCCHERARLV
jgi:hypothetical protein